MIAEFLGCSAVLVACGPMEIATFLDVLLIRRYNGERGANVKILFYAFYPAHLLILGVIRFLIN
jgi:hypothetical protein